MISIGSMDIKKVSVGSGEIKIGSVGAVEVFRSGIYVAQDSDFSGTTNGTFKYIGTHTAVKIPHTIKGVAVTSYTNMFNGTNVTKVVSDNPNVTAMNSMFQNSKATTLDLSNFNTSNVTTMSGMFYNSPATTLDLSSFDTSKVTNMSHMFNSSKTTTLDLSSFDTSNVTNMSYMFRASSTTTLDLSSFDTSKVTNINSMFTNSKATVGYARTQADADRFNNSPYKPAGLNFVVKPYLAQDSDFVDVNGYWVYRGGALEVEIPTHINGELVTSTSYMFSGSSTYLATPVTKVVLRHSNVTNMFTMFYDSVATTLDLSSFDTSNVTNMSNMFMFSQATTLDLSSFNTSNVTDMSYMFYGSQATTGVARTQTDADKFNSSSLKPDGLNFVVKP